MGRGLDSAGPWTYPRTVRIYEVGPRDGLQNEAEPIPTESKLRYIQLLRAAGLREIEATSFVSPKAIPQLSDADDLMALIAKLPRDGVRYPVLVPNTRGMDRAEAAEAHALAVFTAASDEFTKRNIGMTIDESLAAFAPVLARAHGAALVDDAPTCRPPSAVRSPAPSRSTRWSTSASGWSTSAPRRSASATPSASACPARSIELTEAHVKAGIGLDRLAYHFHDTRGTALANVVAGLEDGVSCFDSSTGGTGGCPYAPGAAGNLATEDLVYLLDGLGISHGANLAGVLDAAHFIAGALGKTLSSKVGQAGGWDSTTGQRLI